MGECHGNETHTLPVKGSSPHQITDTCNPLILLKNPSNSDITLQSASFSDRKLTGPRAAIQQQSHFYFVT